jgi:hypothetical protein
MLRLREKLELERRNASILKECFLSKGWKYNCANISFEKGNKAAYIHYNIIVFHFTMSVANSEFNPHHKLIVSKGSANIKQI